jgi:transcriptional regulator with XRE-family HTH domain
MNAENAEKLIERLMSFFNVFSLHELADKLGISQPAISKWKKTNSIIAIKKKCRELGIYNEIFDDFNSNVNNLQNSEFNNSIGVNNGSNTSMNSRFDDLTECDDFTKSLFKQLCKVYKDKTKLHLKLFELIQNAETN